MSVNNGRFEDTFAKLMEECRGDIPVFLTTVASYLRRRTEFFIGTDHIWKQIVRDVFEKEAGIAMEVNLTPAGFPQAKRIVQKQAEEPECAQMLDQSQICDFSEEEPMSIINEQREKSCWVQLVNTTSDSSDDEDSAVSLPPLKNYGNGYSFGKYEWKQTAQQIKIVVHFNFAPRLKDIRIKVAKKYITIGVIGEMPIIKGRLCAEVKPNETNWMIRGDNSVAILLNKMTWWNRLITTDPPISLISPRFDFVFDGMISE